MTTVQEIEKAITHLKPNDLSTFRSWFDEFDAEDWDNQFEKDAKSGKLDNIAQKAVNDFRKGNYKEV